MASTSKAIAYAPQPTPAYILRGHTAQISIVQFSADGRTLYSGCARSMSCRKAH